MLRDIPKPDISPAFTIEDIEATPKERIADIRRRADIGNAQIETLRGAKKECSFHFWRSSYNNNCGIRVQQPSRTR
jgi:hypothetical protein